MKLHLPILLRRAVLAVMAALAASPAVAHTHVYDNSSYTLTDEALNSNYNAVDGTNEGEYTDKDKTGGSWLRPVYEYTHRSHLEMNGQNSNKIVSKDFSFAGYTLPGYAFGGTNPNVKVIGNIEMSTTSGYNAIVGAVMGPMTVDLGFFDFNVGGGRPNVTARGNVDMDGPANAVMLGSTIEGTNITLKNSRNQTTTIGTVTDGILGSFGADMIPANMKDIEGIFNIVQGSKLNATTGSVTLNTATDTAVNKLKANIITGGQGNLSDMVAKLLKDRVDDESLVKTLESIVSDTIKSNDSGSSITAGTDIYLGGGASVIVDTTLSDLVAFKDQKDFAALLAGNENNSTPVNLNAGQNLNLDSIINLVHGAQGGVTLTAGSNILAGGALNVIGGKTTLTANNINLDPSTRVSINQLIGELDQLGDLLSIDMETITGITKNLGDLADQPISANVIAGGSKLTATGTGKDGDITIGGTLGLVMNTPVDKVVSSLMSLASGSEEPNMTQLGGIAKDLLQAGKATSLTSENGNINVWSQFNLMHGGGFPTTTEAENTNVLTLTADNGAVNIQGTANVVSGNVQVYAKDINLTGEVVSADLSKAASGLAGSLVNKIPYGDKIAATGILDKLVTKGSVNMVTGGATLDATGDITMSAKSVDDVGKIGNINAVIDTEIADVVDAVIGGNTDSLVQGSNHMTTLKADGNIDMLGRVNVVNGSYVTMEAGKEVTMQGNISMIGGAKVTADSININTDEAEKYKMYIDSTDLGGLVSENSPFAPIVDSISGIGVNAAIVAGGAKLTATDNITTGGTLGLVVNTPASSVMTSLMSYLGHQQETYMLYELLQPGTATTITSANGSIELGSQLNLVHGGGFTETAGENALKISAANGTVNVQGTANVVSGNVEVNANAIKLTGERLPADMASVAGDVVDGVAGLLPAGAKDLAGGMLDKLVQKGAANIVTGGATLTAGTGGITMSGVHETGAINAVLDTELPGVLQAFIERNNQYLIDGGTHQTTLKSDGNIDMLGRVNVVNGGKVVLDADGDVNLQGNASLISGGATVDAKNININTDESADYKMYIDSTDLGGLVSENSPFAPIVDSISGIGVNAGIVAGGAKLTATDNITIGGTLGLVVNTPMSSVMTEVVSYLGHMQETYMVSELLKPGTATTVTATNGNIEVGAQFNLLHGGGFTANAGENALVLSAANGAVNVEGTFNVVSGNTQVTAKEINMTGEILPADMAGAANGVVDSVADRFIGELPEVADNLLDRLVAKGNANMVTGGATLTATGENGITMSGAANAVIDTELTDVFEAFMDRTTKPLEEGGNHQTTLTSAGNINMLGRLNVVNGSYVKLDAAKDVNLKGTLNMVSGGAKVHGNNINLVGQDNLGLNWDSLLPGDVGNYMDKMGVTDKLNKGVNGNLVLGGAMIEAKNDISISGMASVVMNTPLGSAFEALTTLRDNSWYPELWLAKDVLDDGIATTLKADGNIEMDSRLNMLHGGNIGNADAALKLTAGKEVNIAGTANIISGNTQVTAGEGIKITGKNSVGFDWNQIAGALPEKYAGYGDLAGKMGILDKLSKGVNGSVIAGGATLRATNGDITMEGMATAVVDVTAENVLTAVETMNGTPIMEGGTHATTITAEKGNINMNSRLNLVNGGKVTLNATEGSVNMGGTFNVVSGNATVNAGTNIEMNAQNKVGVDITPMLKGHYAEIAKEMGMADVLENGVSSNIVAGGANLQAEGDVVMSGVATAIVDTTASNVIGAVKGNDLGELMTGGRSTTEVTAGNDIKLVSQMNVVNGGNSQNAGGVVLDAKHDVIMSGDIDVVNRATVKAGNAVAFNGDKSVVKYSDINAKTVSFTGKNAEITDVNFNTASVEVIETALVNTADSEVAISSLIVEIGNIENLGSLELKDAALAGATLHNAGSIEVNGAMTLNSATLSFVADSNNSTFNSTAITLGTDGSIAGISTFSENSSTDMIAGVSFLLHYDGIEFIDNTNEFEYNLAIFQGATADEHAMLKDAIAQNELTLTLDNGFHIESINSMEVLFDNGVVYISGTATVPEPTTATLSLLALAALAARRRRQK